MELKLMEKNLFKFIEVQKTPHFEYHLKSTRLGFIRKNLFTDAFYEYKNDAFKDWLYKQKYYKLSKHGRYFVVFHCTSPFD